MRRATFNRDVDPTEALVLDDHARKVERLKHDAIVELVLNEEALGTCRESFLVSDERDRERSGKRVVVGGEGSQQEQCDRTTGLVVGRTETDESITVASWAQSGVRPVVIAHSVAVHVDHDRRAGARPVHRRDEVGSTRRILVECGLDSHMFKPRLHIAGDTSLAGTPGNKPRVR